MCVCVCVCVCVMENVGGGRVRYVGGMKDGDGGRGVGGWCGGGEKGERDTRARRTLAGYEITPCTLTQFSD